MLFTEFNLEDALEVAKEEGWEDGWEKGREEIAVEMLRDNESIDKIQKWSKLPIDKIWELKKGMLVN